MVSRWRRGCHFLDIDRADGADQEIYREYGVSTLSQRVQRRYAPVGSQDFPENELDLKRLNIQYIQVNYEMEGLEPLLAFYRKSLAAAKKSKTPTAAQTEPKLPKVPRNAATCWEQ